MEDLRNLLEAIRPELCKLSNDDAIHLVDRIDDVLMPVQPKVKRREELEGELRPMVIEFVSEFIDKLKEQLISDHKRWGDTWLNRPKEGQELRTQTRYKDYFDMFEQAGIPVPWLKIIGGALICWVKEQHPELCVDEVRKGTIEEYTKDQRRPIGTLASIKSPFIGMDGYDDKGKPVVSSGKPISMVCCSCNLTKVPGVLVCKCCGGTTYGAKIEPPLGRCESEKPVEEATVKELIESPKSIAEITATPLGDLTEEESNMLHDWLSQSIKDDDEKTGTVRIAHVYSEKITDYSRGTLTYAGKIKLASVKLTCHGAVHPDFPLATCGVDGFLIPTSRQIGIIGNVFANGQYQFRAMQGVGAEDVVLVDYDYEYDLPIDTE